MLQKAGSMAGVIRDAVHRLRGHGHARSMSSCWTPIDSVQMVTRMHLVRTNANRSPQADCANKADAGSPVLHRWQWQTRHRWQAWRLGARRTDNSGPPPWASRARSRSSSLPAAGVLRHVFTPDPKTRPLHPGLEPRWRVAWVHARLHGLRLARPTGCSCSLR